MLAFCMPLACMAIGAGKRSPVARASVDVTRIMLLLHLFLCLHFICLLLGLGEIIMLNASFRKKYRFSYSF